MLAALAAVAMAALCVAQIPAWASLSGLVSLAWVTIRAIHPGGRAVVALRRRKDGSWSLHRRDGTVAVGELHRDCFIHPWLCVVVLRDGWHTARATIPADALDPDAHRRLRVWLRWAPPASVVPRPEGRGRLGAA